jgi:hypothetical protein
MDNVKITPFLSSSNQLDIPYITELSIRKTQVDLHLNNLVLAGKITDNTGRLQKFGREKQEELLFTINKKDNKLIAMFIAVVDGEYPTYMEVEGVCIDRWLFPSVKITDDQKAIVSEILKEVNGFGFDLESIKPKNYYEDYLQILKESE